MRQDENGLIKRDSEGSLVIEEVFFLKIFFVSKHVTNSHMLWKLECNGGPIFKMVLEYLKCVMNLFLSISMADSVMSCKNC